MRYVAFILKAALTIGVMWYLSISFDFSGLTTRLHGADKALLLIGTLQLALQPLLSAWRWHVVLKRFGLALPFGASLRLTYVSMFFNQALPASVGGDGIRTWMASRLGCPLGRAATSVLIDRAAMLCTTIAAAWIASFLIADVPAIRHLRSASGIILLIAIGGVIVLASAGHVSQRFAGNRIARLVRQLSLDVRRVASDPITLITITALCLVSLLNMAITICLYAIGLGASSNSFAIGLLVPFIVLASTLPISIGGWGTREAAMVYLLGFIGIGPAIAILASVLFGAAGIAISLPGALIYLANKKPS